MQKAGLWTRWNALFVDREFFMRSHGQVRFLTVTAQWQKRVATIAAVIIALWLLITMAFVAVQLLGQRDRLALLEREAEVADSESRIKAYRSNIDKVAEDLTKRQDAIDSMVDAYLGEAPPADSALGANGAGSASDKNSFEAKVDANGQKISAAIPEAAALARLEVRQLAFAHRLTEVALARSQRAESAIRKFGLNPEAMIRGSTDAVGGPFIPFFGGADDDADAAMPPALERLELALKRMDMMERTLIAIPSAKPAQFAAMSSGFGYRRDPFTGGGAMHSGIDFKGPHGTPILAAARGVVSHAGWQAGYGKTVEVTHQNGLMTRYAHLSRIAVRAGESVEQGVIIGGMGSTGRSTGTHLHFEVRLNQRAINPRPFLETNSDVLKTQAVARQRTRNSARSAAGG